ncbi:MAG TPA: tetratricopeptide repeat protein [Desulfobacteria bacterium]|nr:tetratricopeptide repeat protein [Desulfobacteria bacterium]
MPIDLAIPSFILSIGICIVGLMCGIISMFLMTQYAEHIRPRKLKLVIKLVYSSTLLFLIGVLLSIILFIVNIIAGSVSLYYIQLAALITLCIGLLGWYSLSLGVSGLYREWTEKSTELKMKLRNIEAEIERKAGTELGIPNPEEVPPFVIDELRKDIKTISRRFEELGIPLGVIKEVKIREEIPEALKHEIELLKAKIDVTGEFYGLEKPSSYYISIGNFYLESKDYEEAIEHYKKVLEKGGRLPIHYQQ